VRAIRSVRALCAKLDTQSLQAVALAVYEVNNAT